VDGKVTIDGLAAGRLAAKHMKKHMKRGASRIRICRNRAALPRPHLMVSTEAFHQRPRLPYCDDDMFTPPQTLRRAQSGSDRPLPRAEVLRSRIR
jgi:hypothetical protein